MKSLEERVRELEETVARMNHKESGPVVVSPSDANQAADGVSRFAIWDNLPEGREYWDEVYKKLMYYANED